MIEEYTRKFYISYTSADRKINLSLVNAMSMIQDMMTEYFGKLKSDNIILKKENNAIWVLTKTKVHFNSYPKWNDIIEGTAFTVKVTPIRVETEVDFRNKEGKLLFYAKQESCVIDLESRKLRKIKTVNYPVDIKTKESTNDIPYLKLKEEFLDTDKVYEQKIYSSDIDFSYHTNNVVYVRYILNSLNCDFLDNCIITDIEIHYIEETKEGQNLKIYRKIKDNEIEFLIKEKERELVRARLKYINDK